jgi:hypothetical protein
MPSPTFLQRATLALTLLCTAPELNAFQAVEGLGSSLAALDDVDGDGISDFALARRPSREAPKHVLDRVWIVSGGTGQLIRTLRPTRPGAEFGRTLVAVGDVDGDRCADLAIAGGGCVWVHSGRDGALVHELAGPDHEADFVLGIAGGHDVDGDDRSDIAVFLGAERPQMNRIGTGHAGVVALHSGATGRLLRVLGASGNAAFAAHAGGSALVRVDAIALTGALAFCADRDGDGRAELVLGTRWSEWFGWKERDGVTIVDALSGARKQRFRTDQRLELAPWHIKALADQNGDGVEELAVAVFGRDLSIVSGADGAELRQHERTGGYPRGEGSSLEAIGDLDADGVADYLWAGNEGGVVQDPGFVARFSGRTGAPLGFLDLDDEELARAICAGADACAIGDVNGDGLPELLVAIPQLDQLRVLSGKDGSELRRGLISAIDPTLRADPSPASAPGSSD